MANQPGLVIDIRPGDGLRVSGPAQVVLIHKSGQWARLRVIADPSVQITKESARENGPRDASMATCAPS